MLQYCKHFQAQKDLQTHALMHHHQIQNCDVATLYTIMIHFTRLQAFLFRLYQKPDEIPYNFLTGQIQGNRNYYLMQ